MITKALEAIGDFVERRGGMRLIRLGPKQARYDYLKRYYLLRTPWFSVFLHRFLARDPDRMHDHPWSWLSVMLAGGYVEQLIDGTCVAKQPGQVTVRVAEEFHTVISVAPDAGTWTLFCHGPRRRVWGELVLGEWRPVGNQYGNKLSGWLIPRWDKGEPGEHDD